MRVLFVTNTYPPCDHGWGYMQLCEEVVDGLHARGHAVAVLTSTVRHGPEPRRSYMVCRELELDPAWGSPVPAAVQYFLQHGRRERRALQALDRAVHRHRAEVVFVWHAIGLARSMLRAAENRKECVVAYYLANYLPELPDEYVAYWSSPARSAWSRLLKRPLSEFALRRLAAEGRPLRLGYPNTVCVSDYVRERLVTQGLVPDDAVVVHNGVDTERFRRRDGREVASFDSGLRCLIAGRVAPEKGVHTVVEALAQLRSSGTRTAIAVTVLGDGPADYVASLRRCAAEAGLDTMLTFHPPVSRAAMPDQLERHSVLILPSEYDEPIARSIQEAMAMGLLVVGTTTGGSGELLVDGRTGLVFEPGDPTSLAAALVRAAEDPVGMQRLAASGLAAVRRGFTIERTLDGVEDHLDRIIKGSTETA